MDIQGLAYSKWSIQVEQTSRDTWQGMCPFEGIGDDRFVIWDIGNYWCNACGIKGWLIKAPKLDAAAILSHQDRERALEEERQKRLAEWRHFDHMERLLQSNHRMTSENIQWWASQGIGKQQIDKYLLGFDPSKTILTRDKRELVLPSYVIPIFSLDKKDLSNIQYRLTGSLPHNVQKYRQERWLPAAEFYAGEQTDGDLIVVEGSKKAIVLSSLVEGSVQVVGIPGVTCHHSIIERLGRFKRLFVLPDPGAETAVQRFANLLKREIFQVCLPMKPDDAVLRGMTRDDLRHWFQRARAVQPSGVKP